MSPMRDGTGRTTSEDRATQLLIWETLSLAIVHIVNHYIHSPELSTIVIGIIIIIIIVFLIISPSSKSSKLVHIVNH